MPRRTPPPRPPAATYTTPEVAALLGCKPKFVRKLTAGGVIPGAMKIGRFVRYSRKAVDAWIGKGVARAG